MARAPERKARRAWLKVVEGHGSKVIGMCGELGRSGGSLGRSREITHLEGEKHACEELRDRVREWRCRELDRLLPRVHRVRERLWGVRERSGQ